MGTQWASDGHRRRKRKSAARTGPLTWCFCERMTRFELATLTLATLWEASVQSVYCGAVSHSPQNRPGNPSSPSSSYTGLPSHARYPGLRHATRMSSSDQRP